MVLFIIGWLDTKDHKQKLLEHMKILFGPWIFILWDIFCVQVCGCGAVV